MKDILTHYLERHNLLGKQVEAKDKEVFDIVHRQVWNECETDLLTRLAILEVIPKPMPEDKNEIFEIRSYLNILD